MAFKKAGCFKVDFKAKLSSLSTDPPGELDVLRHDGDPLGVDCAQVGVLEESNQVGLAGLLQSHDGAGLEPQVSLEVLGDLPDEPLEGKLADEELSRLLVTPDLPEGDGTGPVPVGLLHSTGGGSALAGSLGGQLLPRGLASGRFTGSLLGTSHCYLEMNLPARSFTPIFIPGTTNRFRGVRFPNKGFNIYTDIAILYMDILNGHSNCRKGHLIFIN